MHYACQILTQFDLYGTSHGTRRPTLQHHCKGFDPNLEDSLSAGNPYTERSKTFATRSKRPAAFQRAIELLRTHRFQKRIDAVGTLVSVP